MLFFRLELVEMIDISKNHRLQQLIDSLKDKDKIRILFVCLGNICRSPAAEGVMKAKIEEAGLEARFEIDSAGTGRYHIGQLPDNRMRVHARRRGLELDHRCRQVSPDDFYEFDLIVGMDASNLENLRRMAPDAESLGKIVGMAEFIDRGAGYYDYVPDPYYEGAEGFELVLDLLDSGCNNLLNLLAR